MALSGEVVVAVRIERGERARESLVRLVMIDDDHLGAFRVGSIDRRAGCRAAIKGENQARAFLREPAQRILARAVSFGQPVGDIGHGAPAVGAEVALDQSDRGRPVDIVVAERRNLLPYPDRGGKARGSALHVLEARRVRQERAKRWIEIAGSGRRLSATRGKHAPQQLGKRVGLGDCGGDVSARGVEPLDPAVAPRRALDAKERPCALLDCHIFQGCRHDRGRLLSARSKKRKCS
jgi:hypothetical protein